MAAIIVTNNKKVYDSFKERIEIIYREDFTYIEVLEYVRDKIHKGHSLLTHPLSGSIKPNETPYKSIIISKEVSSVDAQELMIIEEGILTSRKFLEDTKTPDWPEKILDDFRAIDLSLMGNVIDVLGRI